MEDTRENILSTTVLLTGIIRQVRAKVASSLNALSWNIPIQNCSVSTGNPSFLRGASSFHSTKGICLYYSSIMLALFPAWCIKSNSENKGLEIWFKIITGLNFDKLSKVALADGSLHGTWLRASSSIDIYPSLTFFISRWALALLFCCRTYYMLLRNWHQNQLEYFFLSFGIIQFVLKTFLI